MNKDELRAAMRARKAAPPVVVRRPPIAQGSERTVIEAVSQSDIGRMFGVSHVAVNKWRKDPSFPRPIVVVGGRCGWDRDEVRAWVVGSGDLPGQSRTIREDEERW